MDLLLTMTMSMGLLMTMKARAPGGRGFGDLWLSVVLG
jgi:hypothetical protein